LNLHHRDAQMNLERCLEALDTNGEAGLQAELDRLYPGTKTSPAPLRETERVEIAPGMWATIVIGEPVITTRTSPKEAESTK
jgi:hypothetical protein